MKRTRHFLLTVIVLVLCMTFMVTAFACNNDKTDKDPTDDKDKVTYLFPNGNFVDTTGDTYPLSVGSWTSAPGHDGSSSSSVQVPTGSDNLLAGIISVNDSLFKKNKRTYGNIANPGKVGEDENILMLYNKSATSYKYTSSSMTLNKDSYYKLSMSVKTVDVTTDDKNAGAYIIVNGDAYTHIDSVNTNGEWKTYEFFVESSAIASGSISVTLSLGIGNKSTGHMTKGYAFFDNLVLTNLTDVKKDEVAFSKADFQAVEADAKPETLTYSMLLCDAEFEYASQVTSFPYTPSKFNGTAGVGSGEAAPSGGSYVEKGILDTASKNQYKIGDTLVDMTAAPGALGSRILFINNIQPTAYGYKASAPMRFAAGENYYRVSLYVRTVLDSKQSATLKLTKGQATDDLGVVIKDINTNGAWQKVEFFVKSNEKRTNDLFLEMWLGQGGKNDSDTHVKGAVFFDSAKYEEIKAEDYNKATTKFDINTNAVATEIKNDTFKPAIYDEKAPANRTNFGIADTANWDANSAFKGLTNPLAPTKNTSVLVINNFLPTAFTVADIYKKDATATDDKNNITADTFTVNPNMYYLLSLWVKTSDIPEGKGLDVNLVKYDNKDNDKKYADSFSVLASLTGLNSATLKDNASKKNNEYIELQFYITNGQYEKANLGLQFVLGSGVSTQSDKLVIGNAFISAISIEAIRASEFTGVSDSATVKKASLAGTAKTGEVSGNGNFNLLDVTATNELYSTKKDDKTPIWNADGKLENFLGVPTGWTANSKNFVTGNTGSMAGVLDTNSSTLVSKFFGGALPSDFFNGLVLGGNQMNAETNPNVLAINSKDSKSIGYTSSNISLSANSYYMFSVWAKGNTNNTFSIELATTSNSGDDKKFYNIKPIDNDWHQYFIYAQVGASNVSVKLGLYHANPTIDAIATNGETFFANAIYTTITEDLYKIGKAESEKSKFNILVQSWLVDQFDDISSVSDTFLSSPTNWTGASLSKDVYTDKDSLAAGVFNHTRDDWKWIGINPDEQTALAEKMFAKGGNNVLVIDNIINGAYKFTSNATSLTADTYYKVSISMLTYGLKDTQSATLSLKLNNKTYTFGKKIGDTSTTYDKSRRVNTSTYADGKETLGDWTEYSFYIKTNEGVTPSATVTVSLGYEDKDNWMTGYVFVDNFSVVKVDEKDFIARKPVDGETPETIDETLIDDALVKANYRIVFSEDDATAPEEETTPKPEEKKKNDLLWLWISSGVVGAFIVVAVIIYLIKKYAPKRKIARTKKANKKIASGEKPKAQPKVNSNNNRDKFTK
ncbi:MAG: hypothetical protein RR416_00115 [Clostridia bacterium]